MPGFVPERVSSQLRNSSYVLFRQKALLLRLGQRNFKQVEAEFPLANFSALGQACCDSVKIRASSTQAASAVRNFARLVVLDLGDRGIVEVIHGDVPPRCFEELNAVDRERRSCFPMSLSKNEYIVFWDVKGSKIFEDDDESMDTDDEYSRPPSMALVAPLLERAFELNEATVQNNTEDEGTIEGGAMRQIAGVSASTRPTQKMWNELNTFQSISLYNGCPLQLVFDFISCDSTPDELHFVLDAGRPPLRKLPADEFLALYGLQRELYFESHERRPAAVPGDWWAEVY